MVFIYTKANKSKTCLLNKELCRAEKDVALRGYRVRVRAGHYIHNAKHSGGQSEPRHSKVIQEY